MTAVVLQKPEAEKTPAAERVAWLADTFRHNRYMPVPDEIFVGDGDFKAIGAEFLCHFVELGGLAPHHRVLDIGCGIGRMALPLTQWLDPERGSYDGFDPVRAGIAWCEANITTVYPRFRFRHLDLRNGLYNPAGAVDGARLALPYAAASFDFAFMVSVATHLPPSEVEAYAAEAARLLDTGGTLFLTGFVMDGTPTQGRLRFEREAGGPAWHADASQKMAAVAFDDGFMEAALERAGLTMRRRSLGHWRGGSAGHYQDFLIAEKRGGQP